MTDAYKQAKIPIRYLQLVSANLPVLTVCSDFMDRLLRQDPWWFNRAKDGKACGDAISLTPRQELFPGSIADLRNDIGMPVLLCKQWRFLDLSHFPSH